MITSLHPTVGVDLVFVPPGTFTMGADEQDKFATDTERPAHRVTLPRGFALGRHPVTMREFCEFHPGRGESGAEDCPAVNVSWNEARNYCAWLTRQHGTRFRLPSEAEWEFACRGGSASPFHTGDDISVADANFLYDESGRRIGRGGLTTVGAYPANGFGLCDMHGNVCEWVADAWHRDYVGAPTDGSAWDDPSTHRRVIRGGAWDHLPRLLRSAWRDGIPAAARCDNIGFRVAATVEN